MLSNIIFILTYYSDDLRENIIQNSCNFKIIRFNRNNIMCATTIVISSIFSSKYDIWRCTFHIRRYRILYIWCYGDAQGNFPTWE